jgi:preprotein translocase SecF subunit
MWWDKQSAKPQARPDMKPFPFMRIKWIGFIITALIFGITTWSLATRGLNMGLDFTGGVLIEAVKPTPFDEGTVRTALERGGFKESVVQTSEGGRRVMIRLPASEGHGDIEAITRQVQPMLGGGVRVDQSSAVGAKVSGELFTRGIIGCLAAITAIAIYVWFRFESKFGWASFVTTFHDVYAVVGLFSITQMTFDLTIVAGVLTIAGYSINDTVVVFDRIREMLKKYKRMPLPEVIDISITATLTRTVITSVCTMLAAAAMLLLGGPVLFGFAAAICFGIIIGTYSSIFVAAPLLIFLPGRIPGTKYRTQGEKIEETAPPVVS